jgi:ubiquinone/menaquinone biosynthesis C-methylase UbiE
MLLSFLSALGHDCHGVDLLDRRTQYPSTYGFSICNVEVDPLPYEDQSFDAVTCCQVLEHFTTSHLPLVKEMRRVLRPGGIAEIDVPNVANFRNRMRLLRGKNITYDYYKHYLHGQPVVCAGRWLYPNRHNREFTRDELALLFREAGFSAVEVSFFKSRRYRTGLERTRSIGTAIKDAIPSFRKSLIGFGVR